MKKTDAISARYTRLRIIQFAVAEIVLIVGLLIVFHRLPGPFLWPLTVGLVLPTLFSEPYFTGPRTALATAIAQVASYFASDRSTETNLWKLLVVVSALVAVSALLAMLREEKAGQLFHWISTRVGRAVVLGTIVSVILILQVAGHDPAKASATAVIVLILYGVLFLDWARLTFGPSRFLPQSASISAVYAPNQLLVRAFGRLDIGTRVTMRGPAGSSAGYIAEDLASDTGSQYRVVLDGHWRSVTDGSDAPCTLDQLVDQTPSPRGFAIEGSTESTLRVNPTVRLKMGETVEIADDEGPLLYQVAALNLEEETWSGSSAIVARARLVQVGAVDAKGMILARPSLPTPYKAIHSATSESADLSESFMRIGVLKGTSVPVGIRMDWMANHGHLAVLGMSGMGKTTAAAKLAGLAGAEDKFVILDETSEYRTRLSFDVTGLAALHWPDPGVTVCEPGGEMPVQCARVIHDAMTVAKSEYDAGELPRRRFILLEEAHGWLPEWNFTTRDNADAVNRSCRYILQARKFNITFIMVSQRTAVISKSAISQCENYIILRTLDQTSLEYVEGVIGSELKGVISELGKYEAVCVGPIFNSDAPIIVSLDPAVNA